MNLGGNLNAIIRAPGFAKGFCEDAEATKAGAYLSAIEKDVIFRGQALAGRPSEALEVGCESGRWSELLSDLGWRMTCTDIDPAMLSLCQQRLPEAKCILASPTDTSLPLPSNSLPLLLCVEVPEVVQAPWFFPEAARVLKRGGILIGVMFNRWSWRGIFHRARRRLTGHRPMDKYYILSYSKSRTILERAGFRTVFEQGFYWGLFRRTSDSERVPMYERIERSLNLSRLTGFSPWIAFVAQKL